MSEHDSQATVIEWCQQYEGQYPALAMIFAVPNAGKRSIGAARYYLSEGLRSGVPDLILPVPQFTVDDSFTGLVIEMKYGDNKVTEKQRWWLDHLMHYGWKTAVCYSADEAIKVISDYLNIAT